MAATSNSSARRSAAADQPRQPVRRRLHRLACHELPERHPYGGRPLAACGARLALRPAAREHEATPMDAALTLGIRPEHLEVLQPDSPLPPGCRGACGPHRAGRATGRGHPGVLPTGRPDGAAGGRTGRRARRRRGAMPAPGHSACTRASVRCGWQAPGNSRVMEHLACARVATAKPAAGPGAEPVAKGTCTQK